METTDHTVLEELRHTVRGEDGSHSLREMRAQSWGKQIFEKTAYSLGEGQGLC